MSLQVVCTQNMSGRSRRMCHPLPNDRRMRHPAGASAGYTDSICVHTYW